MAARSPRSIRSASSVATSGVPDGRSRLPWRAGVGLKPQYFREVLATRPDVGFFEVHAENYMVDGGPFHHFLGRVREHYALSLHGVGLSIGGVDPLDESHLDRLAAEGMRFTDGHSSSGVCTPSRYALLTGRHHWRDFHGIAQAFDGPVFKPGQLTLPAMLRQQGYATACIGKWHLGMDWEAIRKPGAPKKSIEHSDFDWSKPFPGGPMGPDGPDGGPRSALLTPARQRMTAGSTEHN